MEYAFQYMYKIQNHYIFDIKIWAKI